MASITHIRYLKDNRTLCEEPERLDPPSEFVTADYDPDKKACWECRTILLAHNTKSYEAELLEAQNLMAGTIKTEKNKHFKDEDTAFYVGLLIGNVVWCLLISVLLLTGVLGW